MSKRERSVKTIKIISTIIYVAVTVFLLVVFFISLPDMLNLEDAWAGVGGALLMVFTLAVSAIYIIPIILSSVGLVIAKRNGITRGRKILALMIILPLVTTVVNFLAYYLILTIFR